jgi:hypothetical protein
MYLKTSGITDYQIIAQKDKNIEIYTKAEFEGLDREKKKKDDDKTVNLEKRFDKIEKLLLSFLNLKNSGNQEPELEQINKKLKRIEDNFKLLQGLKQNTPASDKIKDVVIEELDDIQSFIPEISISDMKVTTHSMKTIAQEENNSDAADALAFLQKNGGKRNE